MCVSTPFKITMDGWSLLYTHALSLLFQFSPLSFIYFCLQYSVSLSLPLPSPPFAAILISTLSKLGAHSTHAHRLNEILYVRDPCMQLLDSLTNIFCNAKTCYHTKLHVSVHVWRRGCVLHHTSQLHIPKCNFLGVKRAGWMFIIL